MAGEMGDAGLPPTVVDTANALLTRIDELTVAMADAILTQESMYRELSVVPRDDLERSCRDHLEWVLAEMAGLKRDTRTARTVGRKRAEQAVPLQALLHAYRLGARYVANVILQETAGVMRSEFVLATVNLAWEMLEEYTEAMTSAYMETVNDRTRRDAESRSALAGALLAGELGVGAALADGARLLGLPVQGRFLVAAVHGEQPDERSVEERLRAAGFGGAWHREVETHIGIVAAAPRGKPDTMYGHLLARGDERLGLSAQFGDLRQAATAAREARLALAAAPAGAVVRYEEAPLQVVLVSAPDAARHLIDRVLGPVLELPDREGATLVETLHAWFANEGSPAKTAAAMFVHRNTIGYRATQIEKLTGRRLTDSRDAAELYLALEAQRLLTQ